MINNRQAGRRRGRNNPRPQGNGRSGDSGNRIDNRARGNAVQLLEKYKNLARDAQTQGDRVSTEYYLQFADHYFRVLADNRVRQDEQQPYRRSRDDNRYDGEDEFEAEQSGQGEPRQDESGSDEFTENGARENDRQQDRAPRRDRGYRDRDANAAPVQASARSNAQSESSPAPAPTPAAAPAAAAVEDEAPKVRRTARPRRPRNEAAEADGSVMDAAILPPSISRADNDSDEGEAPVPRKRTRRVRPSAEAAE